MKRGTESKRERSRQRLHSKYLKIGFKQRFSNRVIVVINLMAHSVCYVVNVNCALCSQCVCVFVCVTFNLCVCERTHTRVCVVECDCVLVCVCEGD